MSRQGPQSRVELLGLREPRLLANFACDVSGLLFDLSYGDDLAPYLVGHRRLKQIRQHAPLLVYSDPRHCDADMILGRVRLSLDAYPRLADDPTDDIHRLSRLLGGPGDLRSANGRQETQRLVLFSSAAPTDPLGFLVLGRALRAEPGEARLWIDFTVDAVYVLPEYRSLGHGTALCVAAGICCGWEIRHQVEGYAGRSVTLSPRLCADLLGARHPRLAYAMEARIQTTMDRDMDAALNRGGVCLQVLRR